MNNQTRKPGNWIRYRQLILVGISFMIIGLLLAWFSTSFANAQTRVVQLPETERKTAMEQFDYPNIQDRWIVTSIEIDGELTAAQFGQRVGDEISFTMNPAGGIRIT